MNHLVQRALANFNDGEAFYDHLSDDVVLEFPYGPSLGMPRQLVGLSEVREQLGVAQNSGLLLGKATVYEVTTGRCFAEYTGVYRSANGRAVEVPLVALIEYSGERIKLIREYWDTLLLATLNES